MRIIAGSSKGRKLTPFGTDKVRPTSDKMRCALFNSLASQLGTLEDIIFVDVFAGTGAIGLEAISRGAEGVIFFETDPEVLSILKKNIEKAGCMEKAVLFGDALNPPRYSRAAHVIFLDPPYRMGLISHALDGLLENGYIGPSTLIIAETERGEELSLAEEFLIDRTRGYGRGALHYISHNG